MVAADGIAPAWRGGSHRASAQRSEIDPIDWTLATVPLAVVFGELVLLGANSGVLSASAALLDALVLPLLVFVSHRSAPVLAATLPVLSLVIAAAAWAFVVQRVSAAPAATPLEVAKLLGTTALLLCGVLAGVRRTRAKLLCGALASLGGLYALASFWLYETDPFRVLGVVKSAHAWRFTGTLLNANVAGVVFGVITLTALGWVQSLFARTRASRARSLFVSVGLASVVVGLTACGFTTSRMAFATTVVLGAAMCVAELLAGRKSAREGGQTPRLAALVVVAGLMVLAVGVSAGKVLTRQEAVDDTFNGRLSALGQYTALARERPITGWGLGAFDQVNQSHLRPSSAADLFAFGAAHSSVIQTMLEGGAPYLILLMSAGAVILVRIGLSWRRISDGWSRGLAASVALAAICSIDDIDLNVPAVAGLAALALGVLWGRALAARDPASPEAAR